MLTPPRLRLLKDILAQPTAPFREQLVARCVSGHLQRQGVPFFEDPVGNIVVGAASRAEYRRLLRGAGAEPLRLFIAHMDHPGFHGVKWLDGRRLAVQWLGGSPVRHVNGARVWLTDSTGVQVEGRLAKVTRVPAGWAMDKAEVHIASAAVAARAVAAKQFFGGLAFRAPCWLSGKRLYARAADDLVGVFAIVSTAIDLFKRRTAKRPPFLGLLTRGEEVGFVGAVQHFELGWVDPARHAVLCVSLEASRNLPGAVMGKGPIVRLGDRRTTFDPAALHVLSDMAEKVLPGGHQRRIMDGGACEATAATAWGLPTVGITLPLGNYHNQGLDGGMDCPKAQGPAPEFVHRDDVEGLLRLVRGLTKLRLPWNDPWAATRQRLQKNARRFKVYL
jgi:putative aminopeptidase FrvX